jgi:hypothetical protein
MDAGNASLGRAVERLDEVTAEAKGLGDEGSRPM